MGRTFQTIIGLAILLALVACRSISNYSEPDEPLFSGGYADIQPEFNGRIKVITWNIKFSERIDTAIAELSEVEELHGADILLLQEMDETGVETMAQTLHYNYVYFPASIHSHHHKNFGNAILSKWPLAEPVKLILPHANPKNRQTRTATRAITTIDGREVLVYSVHTETFWLSQTKRNAQVDILATDIIENYAGANYAQVIVGGDFNTLTDQSSVELAERLAQAGLEPVSAGTEPTFVASGLTFSSDHIFAREMAVIDNGVWPDTVASDHFPVRVILSFLSSERVTR